MNLKLKNILWVLCTFIILGQGYAQTSAYPVKGRKLLYNGRAITTFEGIYYIGPGVLAVKKHGAFQSVEKPPKDPMKPMKFESHNVWRFIDTTGRPLFSQKFTEIQPINYGPVVVKRGKKLGFVSRDGHLIIDAICTDYLNVERGYIRIANNQKAGLISPEGKLVLAPIYDAFEFVANGALLAVQQGCKTLYTDAKGNVVPNGKYPIKTGCLIGFMDTTGKEIVKPMYDDFADVGKTGLVQVMRNGKSGLMDNTGRELVPPKYDWISQSSSKQGYMQVKLRDKMGLIDTAGNEVLAPEYDAVFALDQTLVAAKQNDKWGVIDLNGNQHLPFEYETIATLYEDRILVKQNKRWGIVDTTGKVIVEPKYDRVDHTAFDQGKLPVREKRQILLVDPNGRELLGDINNQNTRLSNGAMWERISGNWVLNQSSGTKATYTFDRLRWYSSAMTVAYKDGKAALVDNNGRELTPFEYDTIRYITPNLACVVKGKKNGLVNSGGQLVLPVNYYLLSSMGNGYCAVCDGKAEVVAEPGKIPKKVIVCRWGMADSTGKLVVNPQYDDFEAFVKGYAPISLNKKQGLIDSTGRVVVEPKYDKITAFQGKVAFVKNDNKWGVIDRNGTELIAPTFTVDYHLNLKKDFEQLKASYYPQFYKGYAIVYNGRKLGLVDSLGKLIVEPKYDKIDIVEDKSSNLVAFVSKREKWGVIDGTGKEVVKLQYANIAPFTEGLARFQNIKYGYLDTSGNDALPESFTAAGGFKNGWASVAVRDKKGRAHFFLIDTSGTPMELR